MSAALRPALASTGQALALLALVGACLLAPAFVSCPAATGSGPLAALRGHAQCVPAAPPLLLDALAQWLAHRKENRP